MKKKNKKLLNFWNKIKKPLMILSVVGNILFILFIILGSIGVKKNKTQMVSADSTSINQTFVLNDEIDFSDLSSNGYAWRIDFYNEDFDYYYILDVGPEYSSYRQISYVIEGDDEDEFVVVYDSRTGWTSSIQQTITITAVYNGQYPSSLLFDFLNTNTDSGDQPSTEDVFYLNFEFNKQINYNSPYIQDVESMFVSQSWENVSTLGIEKVYDFPLFLSNGQFFNRVRLWFWNGYATRYLSDTTQFQTIVNDNQNTAYYGFMQYINTYTGDTVEVNYRLTNTSNASSMSDSSVQTYLVKGSLWVNDNYRSLSFSAPLTPEQMNNLSQFNSSLIGVNGFTNVNEDIGLGDVFSLISTSFGAFTNIFRIEILPNITIGLLLFLPLIVGIIIFVIWLIKR